jgi:hypothetical protein
MKNKKSALNLRFLVPLMFLLFLNGMAKAQEQTSCAEKLKTAQTSFARGQTELVPSLLNGCLRSGGFKKEEELAAYKLLIQTYLLNDKLPQADSAMLAFLKSNPEYKISQTDHSSFVYLYKSYDVKPLVKIGFHAGMSKPFLTFVNEVPVSGQYGKSDFSSKATNLCLYFDARFKMTYKIELGFEVGFAQLSFSNSVPVYNLDSHAFSVANYTETQQRLEFPVSMTYDFASLGKNFAPYFRAGAGAAYNLSTKAEVSNIPTDPINLAGSRTGETLRRKDSRIPVDIFGQLGLGLKYKVPHGIVSAEVRTNLGLLNQNVAGGKTVEKLSWYMWADPGFRLNALNLNVGYTYIFYKPSKRAE